MADNLAKFLKNVDKETEELVVRQFVEFHRAMTLDFFFNVIDNSPVWTGRFRGSNTLGLGKPNLKTLPVHPEVESGEVSWPDGVSKQFQAPNRSEAVRALLGLRPYSVTFVANALPYATRIENGHSKELAPQGVYAVSLRATGFKFRRVRVVPRFL